jgi:hypothetical protein
VTTVAAATTTTPAAPVVSGPLAATAVAPLDYTFATATDTVSATITGGTAPYTVTLDVNGAATTVVPTVTGSTYSFAWDTTQVTEGAYTVNISVTDSVGATATTAIRHVTVDRTAPTTFIIAPIAQTYFTGSMPVQAHADDLNGILTVQYDIDGVPAGAALVAPDAVGTYTYSTTLPLTGLADGVHALTAVATDRAGITTTSAPVSFGIGLQPLAATITSPNNLSFGHGTTTVNETILGGTGPYSLQLLVDGVASGSPVTVAPYTLSWNTAGLADGQHSIAVQVTDSLGATATSPAFLELVDNTPPVGVMYQPTALPGYTYDITDGPTTFQVNASDANGVASVQFTVDGAPVGPLLTAPDAPGTFLYTTTVDSSTLTPGSHTISAIVTDNAGNAASANGLSLHSGPITYVPVLNYHGITGPLDETPDEYDQSPAEAAQELAYLQTNGYQSINLEQYETWLTTGALPAGITKPVLITVDDGLTDELAWDPLLQQYGFTAVLFEVTGYADNSTPGQDDPSANMSWAQVQALAATGRWEIAFHAGQYGHTDFSDPNNTIDLGSGQTQTYESTCWTFYTCLGDITTTGGVTPVTAQETPAQFESQIETDITAGVAELKAEVPSASLLAWACPWNACGQWTTQYNDSSNTVQDWLPGYAASQFPIVFTQTDPMQYGDATGTVGAITGDNRHYRFEVLTTTTIDQFAAALTDLAFAAR